MYNSSIANNTTSNKVIAVDFQTASVHKLQRQCCSHIDAPNKVVSITKSKLSSNLGWYEVAECLDISLSMLSMSNLTPVEYLYESLHGDLTHEQPTWDSRQSQGDYSALEPCVDWEAYGKVIA